MTDRLHDDRAVRGATKKLFGAGGVTAAWLLVAVAIGYWAHPPVGEEGCVGTISCLTASEWGDFLAGVFAPIAFVWLVVTVWIQSDELREQRIELVRARGEYELSRGVMEEQAKEAKRQAEYIEIQTNLLASEARLRRADANLTSFTALVRRYIEYVHEIGNEVFYSSGDKDGFLFATIKNFEVADEKFVDFQNQYIRNQLDGTLGEMVISKTAEFRRAYIFIYSAEELVEKIPYHSRVSWKSSKLRTLLDAYADLIRRSPQLSELLSYEAARQRRLSAPGQAEDGFTFEDG